MRIICVYYRDPSRSIRNQNDNVSSYTFSVYLLSSRVEDIAARFSSTIDNIRDIDLASSVSEFNGRCLTDRNGGKKKKIGARQSSQFISFNSTFRFSPLGISKISKITHGPRSPSSSAEVSLADGIYGEDGSIERDPEIDADSCIMHRSFFPSGSATRHDQLYPE